MLTPSPVILSPFALRLRTALSRVEGAQDKLREGSRQFFKEILGCFASLSMTISYFSAACQKNPSVWLESKEVKRQ